MRASGYIEDLLLEMNEIIVLFKCCLCVLNANQVFVLWPSSQ